MSKRFCNFVPDLKVKPIKTITTMNKTIYIDNNGVSVSTISKREFAKILSDIYIALQLSGKYRTLLLFLDKITYVREIILFVPAYDIASIVEDIETYCEDRQILDIATSIKNDVLSELMTDDNDYNQFIQVR
jgi:hypothetical protein